MGLTLYVKCYVHYLLSESSIKIHPGVHKILTEQIDKCAHRQVIALSSAFRSGRKKGRKSDMNLNSATSVDNIFYICVT